MAFRITALPVELVIGLAEYLDLDDKKNLRLTCSKLCSATSGPLFHTLSLIPTSDKARIEAFKHVAKSSHLVKHVRRLRLHTEELGFVCVAM
jgi:hypothetical protein